jgi:CHAT domain-containing protein/Tfp pilus assembly protein PilF
MEKILRSIVIRSAELMLSVLLLGAVFAVHAQTKAELKAQGETEYAAAMELMDLGTQEGLRGALPKFLAAADLFRRADEAALHGESVLLAGRCADDSGDREQAMKLYTDAVAIYSAAGVPDGEAVGRNNIGLLYLARGEMANAREYFEAAERLVTKHNITHVEALVSNNLGTIYDQLGEKAKAVDLFQRAVEAARRENDRTAEAHSLIFLGKVQNELGARRSALEFNEAALEIATELKLIDVQINALNNIGTIWHFLGDNPKSFEFYAKANALIDSSGQVSLRALVLNNIGKAHDAMGERAEALSYYGQALPIAEKNGDRGLQSVIRNNTGIVYLGLEENKRAMEEFQRALILARSVSDKNREAVILLNIGNVHQATGDYLPAVKAFLEALKITETTLDVKLAVTALNNLGTVHLTAEQYKDALVFFDRALPVAKQNGDRELEGLILNNIGRLYASTGEHGKAVAHYSSSIAISRSIRNRSGEAGTLSNLMYRWEEAGNPNLAIFYGKQAVTVYQTLRGNILTLETGIQSGYLESVAGTYRKLASLLVSSGRIAEAEQVLTMLKKEELIDFVRRDDKVAKDLLGTIALTEDERAAISRYELLADKMTAIGTEFAALEAERKAAPVGKFEKEERYTALRSQLADASAAFEKFIEELKIRHGANDTRVAQADASLQKTLDRLKAHKTVAITTIVTNKGVHLIVTTSKTQRSHFAEITEQKLGELIIELRNVLTTPTYDPRPASQALYDVLIKPVETDLAGMGADTILWSLDGVLRYIPPAALWSKDKGYLGERFANAVVSLASRDTLALPPGNGSDWTALGVGVSKAAEGFKPLFAVPEELDCIVDDESSAVSNVKCRDGVLPGRKLLDDEFTLKRFEGEISRYPVIHIASHFQLTPGDDKNSFLLLGGGTERRFTIDKLRNQSLTDVDLIVLSACNTATPGGARSNGVEIEGFGSVAQEAGAKSVIATLWSVFDTSTKDLMVEFYRSYRSEKITKAEALRRAQLAVMNGKYSPADGAANRGASLPGSENNARSKFAVDPKAPFAHPYYWSPFTLMGNWR